MRKALILSCLSICLLSCAPSPVEKAASALRSATTGTIDERLDALENAAAKGLSRRDARALIDLLGKPLAPRAYDYQDTNADILICLRAYGRDDIIPELMAALPVLSPVARSELLTVLQGMDSARAVDAVFSLLALPEGERPEASSFRAWRESLVRPEAVFPRLLDFMETEDWRFEILLTLLEYLQAEKLEASALGERVSALLAAYRETETAAGALGLDQSRRNWFYDEDYGAYREDLALFLDIFGWLEGAGIDAILQAAAHSADPRLAYFALVSRERRGWPIDAEEAAAIARDGEMRSWIFDHLKESGRLNLIPARWRSQAELAASELVNWLVYPTELGRAPDEILLGKRVRMAGEPGEGPVDYYLFRFRVDPPHWAAENGWMAGVSGPFRVSDSPTTEALGDTFSALEPWDAADPDRHLRDLLGVDETWENPLPESDGAESI